MPAQITPETADKIKEIASFLYAHPWSTRAEIEAHTGFDTRTIARLIRDEMNLRHRPRPPSKVKPYEYALPAVKPNPFKVAR